jgi:uncharacterized membrane protein YidH (DUF202 family)
MPTSAPIPATKPEGKSGYLSEVYAESATRAPYSTPADHGNTPIEGSDPASPASPTEPAEETRSRKKKKKAAGKEKAAQPTSTKLSSFRPSIVLENSGSVARDHLASERTYLAYVRTSLALATTGVGKPYSVLSAHAAILPNRFLALVQLFAVAEKNPSNPSELSQIQKFARPLGATIIIFALLVLLGGRVHVYSVCAVASLKKITGVYRYFIIQRALTQGQFPITRVQVTGMAFILGSIITIVFGVLVSPKS